jgi:hypothetical protein
MKITISIIFQYCNTVFRYGYEKKNLYHGSEGREVVVGLGVSRTDLYFLSTSCFHLACSARFED